MPKTPNFRSVNWKSPRVIARVVLGVLLAANLAMALIVFKPWAGSLADLERQGASLRAQVQQQKAALERLRGVARKVETARADGDRFMDANLMSRRTLSSTLLNELERSATKAGIKQKEASNSFEPVEGAEALTKAIITAHYEGTYADLMQLLNLIDRSPRFLIVESLQAAPQQTGLTLNVIMKLNAFVKEGEGMPQIDPSVTGGEPAQAEPGSLSRVAVERASR